MYTRSKIARYIVSIMSIGVFAMTSVPLTANDAFADQRGRRGDRYNRADRDRDKRGAKASRYARSRDKRRVISRRHTRRGREVFRRPWAYGRDWYRRRPYYYSRRPFYRPARFGFRFAGAPVGTVFVSLPFGYQRIWVDGSFYYGYGGTLYRRVPAGYEVVARPPAVITEEATPVLVQPSRTASGTVIVDAPVLNVRSGPSFNDPRIYQVDEGHILEVHGKSDGWLYVQLPNGKYGWVKAVFTEPLRPASG